MADIDEGAALLFGVAERLFHQHVLAVPREEYAAFVMQVVRKRDEDRVDLVGQLLEIRGDVRMIQYLRHRFRAFPDDVADRDYLNVFDQIHVRRVRAHHTAAPDQSDA